MARTSPYRVTKIIPMNTEAIREFSQAPPVAHRVAVQSDRDRKDHHNAGNPAKTKGLRERSTMIALQTTDSNGKPRELKMYVYGYDYGKGLAITQAVSNRGHVLHCARSEWRITHVPTGMSMRNASLTFAEAKRIIVIMHLLVDWFSMTSLMSNLKLNKSVTKLYDLSNCKNLEV